MTGWAFLGVEKPAPAKRDSSSSCFCFLNSKNAFSIVETELLLASEHLWQHPPRAHRAKA